MASSCSPSPTSSPSISPRLKRLPTDEELLTAVVELADDGFCPTRDLYLQLRAFGSRELRRGIKQTVRRGLLLERQGPDGRFYVALSSEGWERFRASTP
jgi:hypothetical protein